MPPPSQSIPRVGCVVTLSPGHCRSLRVAVPRVHSLDNGAKIVVSSEPVNERQLFRIIPRPNDAIAFENLASRRLLDDSGTPGHQCHLWENVPHNPNQDFRILQHDDDGGMMILSSKSKFALDVSGSQGDGAALITFPPHTGSNQIFYLSVYPAELLDRILARSAMVPAGYRIVPRHAPNLCVTIPAGGSGLGAPIVTAPISRDDIAQLWRVVRIEQRIKGTVAFVNLGFPGKAIDDRGLPGTETHTWAFDATNMNQHFRIDGSYDRATIVSPKNGFVFHINPARTEPGANLQTVVKHPGTGGANHQLFSLRAVLESELQRMLDLKSSQEQQRLVALQKRTEPLDTTVAALNAALEVSKQQLGGGGAAVISPAAQLEQLRRARPEFAVAIANIALAPHWLMHSRLQELIGIFNAAGRAGFKSAMDQGFTTSSADFFNYGGSATSMVAKAYRIDSLAAVERQIDPMTGHAVFESISKLYHAAPAGKKMALAVSYCVLSDLSNADNLNALLSQVTDRASRCASAQQHGIDALILAAGALVLDKIKHSSDNNINSRETETDTDDSGDETVTPDAAFVRLTEVLSDALDDYKIRTISSALLEPARLYFMMLNDRHGVDHVHVHGLNWYIAIAESMGIGMPLQSADDGDVCASFDDIWAPSAWSNASKVLQYFRDPSHFGGVAEGAQRQLASTVCVQQRIGYRPPEPTEAFRAALASSTNGYMRSQFASSAENIAHFFRPDVLVPRFDFSSFSETNAFFLFLC